MRIIVIALIASLILVSVAFADATWNSTDGPNWDGTNWVLTGTATITDPQNYVCLSLDVVGGPNAGSFSVLCSGTSSFMCTVPGSSIGDASFIDWRLFAYSSDTCTGDATAGDPPTGGQIGPTGPNAVKLRSFEVSSTLPIEKLLNRFIAIWRQ